MTDYNEITTSSSSSFWESFFPMLGIIIALAILGMIIYIIYRYFKLGKIRRAQNWVMLQVNMPREIKRPDDPNNKAEEFKQLIAVADNFFSSLSGQYISGVKGWLGQPKFSFEIIAKNGEIFFFIGIPKHLVNYFEKQVHSHFPYAQLERSDNFKIVFKFPIFNLGTDRGASGRMTGVHIFDNLLAGAGVVVDF